jgi:hypothetical protein
LGQTLTTRVVKKNFTVFFKALEESCLHALKVRWHGLS